MIHQERLPEMLENTDPRPGDDNDSFHPAIFDDITSESIRAAALHTHGAAGPSELDELSWRRRCTALGLKSNDLCAALAADARIPHSLIHLPCWPTPNVVSFLSIYKDEKSCKKDHWNET